MAAGKNQKVQQVMKLVQQLRKLEMEILLGDSDEAVPGKDLPMETVDELKSTVDSLRASIWCYIQCRREHSNESVAQLTSHYRMRRVVEMLRQARTARQVTSSHDTGLERLEVMTDQTVKTYLA